MNSGDIVITTVAMTASGSYLYVLMPIYHVL